MDVESSSVDCVSDISFLQDKIATLLVIGRLSVEVW